MFRRGTAFALWFGAAALFASPAAAEGVVPRLEQRVAELMESSGVPGLSIALVDGGQRVYSRGFGLADRTHRRPVERETLFQIGSATKALTSILAVMLEREGKLTWSDTLADRLPAEILPPDRRIGQRTLLQLATHTAALPRQPPTLRRVHDDYPVLAFSHFELGRSLAASRLVGEPGTFSYSNFGYGLLGYVLERVSGEPYETLLRERLFEPLEMDSSTVTIWPHLEPRLARPYYRTAELTLEDYTPWDMEALAPAGGVASTAGDMARLLEALISPEDEGPIDRALVDTLVEGRAELAGDRAYALGWIVEPFAGGGEFVHHGGEVDGYSSYLAFHPRQRVGVVLLSNTGNAPLESLGRWVLLQLVRPAPVSSPAAD